MVWKAICEGYAEYVTAEVARRLGDGEFPSRQADLARTSLVANSDEWFAYVTGREFFQGLGKGRRGAKVAIADILARPPVSRFEIVHPGHYACRSGIHQAAIPSALLVVPSHAGNRIFSGGDETLRRRGEGHFLGGKSSRISSAGRLAFAWP